MYAPCPFLWTEVNVKKADMRVVKREAELLRTTVTLKIRTWINHFRAQRHVASQIPVGCDYAVKSRICVIVKPFLRA
jgi:hypothetical protein